MYEKLYVYDKILRTRFYVDLSKIYFLKNEKKTFKPNNCDLNRDWIKNNEIFAFITGLVFKLSSRIVLLKKRKDNTSC